MLIILAAMIVFLFLLLGAAAFLLCIAIPRLRRFALSTALWFAVWGPCLVALLVLTAATLFAGWWSGGYDSARLTEHPQLKSLAAKAYVSCGLFIAAIVASLVAWLHQFLIHRFTFPLFRLYGTAVTAGIGSVLGWAAGWWLLARTIPHMWVLLLLFQVLLIGGFGAAAYRGAHLLRGESSGRLTWITPEEFRQE